MFIMFGESPVDLLYHHITFSSCTGSSNIWQSLDYILCYDLITM